MGKATSIAQNYPSLFIGGDPYTYASVGSNNTITLPLSTSIFVLSNEGIPAVGTPGSEGHVAAVNGQLKVSIPDAKHIGMEIILYLEISDSVNPIVLNFTGLNSSSDEITLDSISTRDFPVVMNLIWTGSAWVLRSGGTLVTAVVS